MKFVTSSAKPGALVVDVRKFEMAM